MTVPRVAGFGEVGSFFVVFRCVPIAKILPGRNRKANNRVRAEKRKRDVGAEIGRAV